MILGLGCCCREFLGAVERDIKWIWLGAGILMFTVCVSVVCTRPARTLKDAPNIKYIDDQNSKQRYAELFA